MNWLLCWLPRVTQGRGLLVQKYPVVTTMWACQQSKSTLKKNTFETKMWSAVDYDAFNLYFKGTVQGNQHKISGTFERVVSNTLAGRIVARSSVFETPAVETFVFSSSETIVLPFLAVLEQQQLFAIQLLCK